MADHSRVKVTPRARKVAMENSLDFAVFSKIMGTGFDGGICERDLQEYLNSNKAKASPLAKRVAELAGIDMMNIVGSGINGKVMKRDVEELMIVEKGKETVAPGLKEIAVRSFADDGREILEEVPYAGIRKIIGDKLSLSKFTAPHLYFTQKVNLEKLLDFRKSVNEAQDHKLSVTDFISKAVINALKKYPDVNTTLIDNKIIKFKTINLGIAVAAPGGLIVPTVKNAETLNLIDLGKDSAELFKKARDGKLEPKDYSLGTFTISNLGMFGIENFTAIINYPEAAILSVSSTKDEPVVVEVNGKKEIAIKPMMNITLSVDHRLIDGLLAAQFVGEVKAQLESPLRLVL